MSDFKFGFALIFILFVLAVVIALGHVSEDTSYGLMPIVVALSNIGVMWSQNFFERKKVEDKKDKSA